MINRDTQFCVPNLIVLVMKIIYIKNLSGSVTNIVKAYHDTEKYIFATKGILHKFDSKWNLYESPSKKTKKQNSDIEFVLMLHY